MQAKDTLFYKKRTINCNGILMNFETPKVMAIINITPDSFYDGGKYFTTDEIKKRTYECMEEGSEILDVGAYSTRPGAEQISEKEEIKRLDMALSVIRKMAPGAVISLDSFRAGVAETMIKQYNINIINDISGGQYDENIYKIAAEYKVPYILMHIKGTPQTMQLDPHYNDVFTEIMAFFVKKLDTLYKKGVNDVIIDPGFGFGKTLDQNYILLKYLQEFKLLDNIMLTGISRKSMVYKLLNISPDEALYGSTALHMAALLKRTDILRVHDVKQAKQVIEVYKKIC